MRLTLRLIAMSLTAILVATACATAAPAPSGGGASAAPAEKAPDTVVWDAIFTSFDHVDMAKNTATVPAAMLRTMYEPLMAFVAGDATKVQPLLAASYTASADFKTHTVKLRANAKFADGTPVTSADWLFTWNRLKNLKDKAAFLLTGITFSAPDPLTLTITTATPMPELPVVLTSGYLGVMNSKIVKANGGTDAADADKTDKSTDFLNKNSAGSGPYVLQAWEPGQRMSVTANPAYWGSRKPALKQIVLQKSAGGQAQIQNLQGGVAQIGMDMSVAEAGTLDVKPTAKLPAGLQVAATPGIRVFVFTFNLDPAVSKTSSNLNFRQAVRAAIDYDAILKFAGQGAVIPSQFMPNIVAGTLPASEAPKQDLAKARSLLASSGLPTPISVSMAYATDNSFNGLAPGDFAQIIQKNLDAVGIKMELKGAPNATSFQAGIGQGRAELGLAPNSRLPDLGAQAASYCPIPPAAVGVSQSNPAGWVRFFTGVDPQSDANCNALRTTTGTDARIAAFQKMARRFNEFVPFLSVIEPAQYVIADKRLKNAVYSPSVLLDWYTIGQTAADPGKNE